MGIVCKKIRVLIIVILLVASIMTLLIIGLREVKTLQGTPMLPPELTNMTLLDNPITNLGYFCCDSLIPQLAPIVTIIVWLIYAAGFICLYINFKTQKG